MQFRAGLRDGRRGGGLPGGLFSGCHLGQGEGPGPAGAAAAFVVAVWAVTDFYDAFHKKPIDERVAGQGDERDVYLAMKSSRAAMRIFNKSLFLASVLAFWVYARFGVAFLLPVAVTLAAAVLFLFLLLLGVNLYYEKRG